MAFGERLQELRRARGMTQEDFAAQLKVSRQAVSKWESCRGYPELEKIIYICNRYGVTMNDLFCEEVPLGGQETPAAPERMESRTLKTALGDFVSNLSPANKWAGVGGLAAVTALVALCMLYLKGGGDSEMTALWIAAIVVFGVVEAVTAGLVTIDNDSASGAVYVDGKTWTARSADGSVLPAGSRVEIQRMEGVKLIVEAAQKAPDKKEEVV